MYETFHCPSCQAPLNLPQDPRQRAVTCSYCSSTVVVPDHLRNYVETHTHDEGQQKLNVMYEIAQLLESGNKIEAIKLFRDEFGVGLKEAKLAVEALEKGTSTAIYTTTTTHQTQQSSGKGCLTSFLVLLVLAIVGGVVYAVLGQNARSIEDVTTLIEEELNSESGININTSFKLVNMSGPAIMLPVGDGQLADIVYVSRDLTDEVRYLHYYEGESDKIRWASEALADVNADFLFADDAAIYMAVETELTAFNRADGQQRWQITLSDRFSHQCDDCFLSFPDVLTFLTYDNKLQAIDQQTGSPLWQQSVTSVRTQTLFTLDGKVGVVNEMEETGVGLDIIEPATGELAMRIEPRCDHDFFDPQEPNTYDPIVVDDTATAVYLTYGFFEPACVQKWDVTTGEMVWNTFMETANINADDMGFVQTRDTLFFNDGSDQLFAVNKEDGSVTLLAQVTDHSLYLLEGNAAVLIAKAENNQGTRRDKLWGFDATTGERLWEQVPQADTWLEPDDNTVIYSGKNGHWDAHMTLAGVQLLQARQNPPRLVVETLNAQTGASSGQSDLPLESSSTTSYWFEVLGWDGNVVWVKADSKQLLAVDMETATAVGTHTP